MNIRIEDDNLVLSCSPNHLRNMNDLGIAVMGLTKDSNLTYLGDVLVLSRCIACILVTEAKPPEEDVVPLVEVIGKNIFEHCVSALAVMALVQKEKSDVKSDEKSDENGE